VSRFIIHDLSLAGLKRIERQRLDDQRGFFARLFCADELRSGGWRGSVAQINHTRTARKGTVRGLHFQRAPHAEMKLVSCIRGEVWDLAVDLRRGSPTFLRWHAERLSAVNNLALLIPVGFAHGFQALSDETELIYCHSAPYAPDAENGLNVNDPRLGIAWPLPVGDLSARDAKLPFLDDAFTGIAL
jgi:dTDP-4-dehydrorhamnose 3,5-epimerase